MLKSFNLSYQTFSTIGFGIVYPSTTCSNIVMVVESFASMLVTSAITGLVFAKFAKPRAKVAFSNVCVIQPYGKRYLALVMRVANATQSKDVTHDVIMEANFKVHLLRIEQKQSDKQWAHAKTTTSNVLCSYNLKLLQHNFITFRMGLAVVHIINEESPLFGMSEADLAASDMIIEIAMSGVDSTLQDTVSERYTYTAEDIRWGFRFAEMLEFDEFNSDVIMDFAQLSAIETTPIDYTPRFLRVSPINIPKSYDFMRLYNSALYVRWPRIIMVFVICFIVINVVFALIYWANMKEITPYPDIVVSDFELAFFMSVHTIATIGYGSISPDPTAVYMNIWVLIESSLGIIAVTIITGIAWAKFARPRAHIHFSTNIAVTSIYGHRCLMFRAGNTRHSGDVHENFFRIGVILTNRKTGLRQIYDVPLVRAEWPSIKLPATLIHVIDESSPFYKFQSLDQLSESRVAVIALLTGLDTTFSENVYARKMYFWDDFAFGVQFDDFAVLRRDCIEVDFERFDALIPEDTDHTWSPRSA
ncbi:hypothetical protein ATCC90586_010006 [Pythium insidiosum]|nr:hypothetical protein ATCC90586_010006 [Pythium insidiosum]